MPIGFGAIAAGGIGGQLLGGALSGGDRDKAAAARDAALKQWLSLNVPDPAQQRIELAKYQSVGSFSPQLQKTFEQDPSGLKNMQIDPTGRAAEVQALQGLQNISSQGGMDAQAKQQEQEAINQANAQEQGSRGAILQNYASRGLGGAGASLAAQLQDSQSGANRSAEGGLASAANAQQRALQAMTAAGTAGTQLRSQDYNQAAKAAEAQDAINKFNTQNSQSVAGRNVDIQNQAQLGNLNAQQDIANRNTGVANDQERFNKGLLQQQYQNQVQKAQGASGAYGSVANAADQSANRTQNQWAGIGSAIGQGGAAYGQYANAQADRDFKANENAKDRAAYEDDNQDKYSDNYYQNDSNNPTYA